KRKYIHERRLFNETWTEDYFLLEMNSETLCLTCRVFTPVFKEYNLKRHYAQKHASKFDAYQGMCRKDKVAVLKKGFISQQKFFNNVTTQTESIVKASYFVNCGLIFFPHLSSTCIKILTKSKACSFKFYSLIMNESTEATDTAQFAIFIRGINDEYNITEEMASLVPLKDTKISRDLYEAVKKTLTRFSLSLSNISGVATDGAPAMIGKKEGLVKLIEDDAIAVENSRLMKYHCIIHQENLCGKALKMNHVMQIVVKTVNFIRARGSTGPEGRCDGSTYTDLYGTWTNVVVQALVKITLKSYTAPVRLSDDKIILKSGQQCRWQSGHCLDNEDGFTYWETAPHDYCKFQNYDVLFDGKATKIIPEDRTDPRVYSAVTGDITFALAKTGQLTLCGYTLIKTEHPKLFVLEVTVAGRSKANNSIPINNLDIFTHVNTKFVYVEKHIKTQIKSLYQNLMKQRCAMENQLIQNALTLIHVAPEDVATTITKKPGYLAVPSGEVLHIVKCIPVTCQMWRREECYNELPVLYRNESYFLTPKNRILTRHGTRRDCNDIMPPMYKIHGTLFRFLPKPIDSIPPIPLQSISKSKWHYIDPYNLASAGIYSTNDLNRLKEHIMFPVEKSSIINSMAQGASGRAFSAITLQMSNLLDESALQKIAESTAKRLWTGFITFGSISTGVIGVYITFRIIKLVIGTILNGIALHAAYGWGLRLVAAVWSSLAHFCIYLNTRDQNTTSGHNPQQIPHECISVVTPSTTPTDVETAIRRSDSCSIFPSQPKNTPTQRQGTISPMVKFLPQGGRCDVGYTDD
ncbi:General transcription factor II-I repeat domain-containing protein 2, partial [Habropoda laboriosa]